MVTPPRISIIIPTLNEEHYLPLLLHSLSTLTAELEIIVVDGNSTDRTRVVAEAAHAYLKENHSLKIIPLTERGIALQRNTGAKAATHDILLFCDADVIAPSEKDFEYFISEFVSHNYAIATGKLTPSDGGRLEKIFLYYVAHAALRLLLLIGKPYFGGAFQITRRDVFETIGGYDESLRISEDVDYAFKAAKLGPYKLINIKVLTSARRFLKYGYSWIFMSPVVIIKTLFTGRLEDDEKVEYRFGEY